MQEYKGVRRSEAPAWQGWKIIDDYSKTNVDTHTMAKLCENNIELQELVAQFNSEVTQ